MNVTRGKVWKFTQIAAALSAVIWGIWLLAPAVLWPGGRAAADPRLFDVAEAVVERVGPAPETGKSARLYKELVEEGAYHAAMAMNPTGGFGWADNHARIEDAEAIAMAWCAAEGPGCEIILRITPGRAVEIEGVPLSYTAARAALEYLDKPAAKAFALTGHGGWGGAWDRRSRREAVKDAMARCAGHEVTEAPGLEITTPCRVIWVD